MTSLQHRIQSIDIGHGAVRYVCIHVYMSMYVVHRYTDTLLCIHVEVGKELQLVFVGILCTMIVWGDASHRCVFGYSAFT